MSAEQAWLLQDPRHFFGRDRHLRTSYERGHGQTSQMPFLLRVPVARSRTALSSSKPVLLRDASRRCRVAARTDTRDGAHNPLVVAAAVHRVRRYANGLNPSRPVVASNRRRSSATVMPSVSCNSVAVLRRRVRVYVAALNFGT
jgi:hypothetical protein